MPSTIEQLSRDISTAGDAFPLLLQAHDTALATDSLLQAVSESRDALLQYTHQHGALLLRGFRLHSDADFDALIQALALPNFTYAESLSNAVRRNRSERVFTANEAPADVDPPDSNPATPLSAMPRTSAIRPTFVPSAYGAVVDAK